MVWKLATALLIGSGLSIPAHAFEWETLYSKGDWRLDLNIHDDGELNCEARTSDFAGTVFMVESWDDRSMSITFFNEAWDFGEDIVDEDFRVRVGQREHWSVNGSKAESSIWAWLDDDETAHEFLAEVYTGSTLYLMNDQGSTVSRFSLQGSASTLNALAECAQRIEKTTSDPFGGETSSDPF